MADKLMNKILVADDDEDIRTLLEYQFSREGFVVETAENGKLAIEKATRFLPDLILLDIMMPVMDGIEACAELRQNEATRYCMIAFLTARTEDYSQVLAFEVGADDYIRKPIKPRVLISRVKALLRRKTGLQIGNNRVHIGNLIIDKEKYEVEKGSERILLPKKEFELLTLLISKPGKVFPRETIMETVWGNGVVVGDRTIDVHISKLRDKLGDKTIKTIKGIGYKIEI